MSVKVFVGVVGGLLLGVLVSVARPVSVNAQSFMSSAERLRFRLVGDEPIASPDGRSVVAGWKVVVLRDMKADQCYVSFVAGTAMAVTGPSVCP